jgi:hypothetical protein
MERLKARIDQLEKATTAKPAPAKSEAAKPEQAK